MLKKLALIYFVLAILESAYRLVGAVEIGAFNTIKPWFSWAFNITGLVAVYAYATQRGFIPKSAWQVALAGYVVLRTVELVQGGLFNVSSPLQNNIIIALQYTWYVVPSVLSLVYWSLQNRGENAL